MDKDDVVRRLQELAILLELQEANPFEIAAFRNAAISLDEWDGDLDLAVAEASLTEIDAVGKGIAGLITEFVRHGSAAKYDALRGHYPETFFELFAVPGLGLKKVKALHAALGVGSLAELEQAARSGAIRTLRGFGARSEERILRGIEWARRRGAQHGAERGRADT